MIDNSQLIADRIRSRRKELKLSVVELSEMTGISRTTLHRYESGQIKKIKLPVMEILADKLKVNPAWLVAKSDDKFLISRRSKLDLVPSAEIKDVRVMLAKLVTYITNNDDLIYGGKPLNQVVKMSLISSIETAVKLTDKMQE